MRKWWISSPKFTGQVDTTASLRIITTPPVWKSFKGQQLSRLIDWLIKLEGDADKIQIEDLKERR